jgi:uncharacterized membrane protein
MKNVLRILFISTLLLIAFGAIALGLFDWKGNWMLKAGMASLAFVLIPFFLFYRFDTKQQDKNKEVE